MSMCKYLFDNPIFYHPFFSEELDKIEVVVRENLEAMLLKPLNEEEKKILLHETWEEDRDGYVPGKNISLIQRLLRRAGISISCGFQTSRTRANKFKGRSIYVYDSQELCGVSIEKLEDLVQSINEKWGLFAEITLENHENETKHLSFEFK